MLSKKAEAGIRYKGERFAALNKKKNHYNQYNMVPKRISGKPTNENSNKWCCIKCGKNMESEYILNFHLLLEHSKSKRSPVGVA